MPGRVVVLDRAGTPADGWRLFGGEGTMGMNITITTSAANDDECRALLDGFNFPFK